MDYLFYIQPNSEIIEELHSFIETYPDVYKVHTPFAHCTVMRASFPSQNQSQMTETLDNIAKSHDPFEVELGKIKTIDKNLFTIGISSSGLIGLHMKIIEGMAPLIDRDNPLRLKPELRDGPKREEMVKKYGYPHAGEFYTPHLTLFSLRPNHMEVFPGRFEGKSWTAKEIRIAFLDQGKYHLLHTSEFKV